MAIIEDLGLVVTIQVNGTPLDEYDDPNPSEDDTVDRTLTAVSQKYVEARDDAEYRIHCKALPGNRWLSEAAPEYHLLLFEVEIDGKLQAERGLSWNRQVMHGGLYVEGKIEYRDTQVSVRRFRFRTIQTVDAADAETVRRDLQRASSLGLIRILVFRVLYQGTEEPGRHLAREADLTVAEEALKGETVSLGTVLSPATVGRSGKKPHRMRLAELVDKHPCAIFTFKYRSKGDLQNQMIIPRSPGPEASDDEGLEGLSLDDIRRLARERLADVKKEKAVKDERPTLKREYDGAFDLTGDTPRVTLRERAKRDTVDLTED